jgi:3-methyladenine DNA glycosylase AlkD
MANPIFPPSDSTVAVPVREIGGRVAVRSPAHRVDPMSAATVVTQLRDRADPARIPGMARVGIDVSHALGVSVPDIRAVAKGCGIDHQLARALWRTGIHEARILATLVADPEATGEEDM